MGVPMLSCIEMEPRVHEHPRFVCTELKKKKGKKEAPLMALALPNNGEVPPSFITFCDV